MLQLTAGLPFLQVVLDRPSSESTVVYAPRAAGTPSTTAATRAAPITRPTRFRRPILLFMSNAPLVAASFRRFSHAVGRGRSVVHVDQVSGGSHFRCPPPPAPRQTTRSLLFVLFGP